MKNIFFVIVLPFITLSIFLFFSCKENKSQENSQKIVLDLCSYKQENEDGLRQVIKKFEAKYPNIEINLERNRSEGDKILQERADVGNLPDIMQLASYARIKEYASRGLIVDVSKSPIIDKLLPNSFDSVMWNGRIYAVPMDYSGIGIIYDKDIFAKFDINPPKTFNELKSVCQKLKANGIYPFAGLLKDIWSMGHFISLIHTDLLVDKGINLNNYITEMNAGKNTYANVDLFRFFELLDFYGDNMNPEAAESDSVGQQEAFASKKCAMMVQGLWSYFDAKQKNPNLNAGFIPFPYSNDESKNVFFADVDSALVISSQSSEEKTEACFKFLEWLSTNEGEQSWIKIYKLIPPFKGVDVSFFGGPYVELMNSIEKKGANPWLFSQYPTIVFDDACKNGTQQYLLKKRSAKSLLQDIDEQWKKATSK